MVIQGQSNLPWIRIATPTTFAKNPRTMGTLVVGRHFGTHADDTFGCYVIDALTTTSTTSPEVVIPAPARRTKPLMRPSIFIDGRRMISRGSYAPYIPYKTLAQAHSVWVRLGAE